jgi:hypothetical protein
MAGNVSQKKFDWAESLHSIQLGQHCLLLNGYWHSFAGVMRPRHEVHPSPPRSAEVKNEWSYTSTPPISLHGVDGDNLTLHAAYTRPSLP